MELILNIESVKSRTVPNISIAINESFVKDVPIQYVDVIAWQISSHPGVCSKYPSIFKI